MTRVAIAAGGTAGHVVPALAVADALRDRGAHVEFLGGERAEAELVPAAGYPFHPLRVAGLDRRNPLKAARALLWAGRATGRARRHPARDGRRRRARAAAATWRRRSGLAARSAAPAARADRGRQPPRRRQPAARAVREARLPRVRPAGAHGRASGWSRAGRSPPTSSAPTGPRPAPGSGSTTTASACSCSAARWARGA